MKKSKQRGRKQFRRCHFFEQAGRKRSQTKRGHGINHNLLISLEAATRFELVNSGFADRCLTTWLCRQKNGAGNGI